MPTEYTLTYKEYRAAQWLYLKRRPSRMLLIVWMFWIIPLIALAMLLLYFFMLGRDAEAASRILLDIPPLLIVGAILPALREWTVWKSYFSLFPKGKAVPQTFSFDEEQIFSATPGQSEGRIRWHAITEFKESDKIALFFFTKNRYLPVPKRVLPEQQWAEVRALVTKSRSL